MVPELTIAESEFANSVSEGRWCTSEDEASQPVVRAVVIRSIALGLPVIMSGHDVPGVIGVSGLGLAVKSVRITGILDLCYGSTPDGLALPPLLFEDSVFEQGIDLSNARLRGFSLRGSAIKHLQAKFAEIGGHLDLTGVRTSEETATGAKGLGLCWIQLAGAVVGGDLDARRAALVAPPKRPDHVDGGELPHYALDARGARIGGTIRLETGFSAVGGLSLRLARVEGDVRLGGAHLVAVEQYALDGTGVDIKGFLTIAGTPRGRGNRKPLRAEGHVWLQAARIGGSLSVMAAEVNGDIIAPNIVVGANAQFGSSADPPGTEEGFPFKFHFLNLYGCSIASTLTIRPSATQTGPKCDINLSSGRVGTLRESGYALRAAGVRLLMKGLQWNELVTDRNDLAAEQEALRRGWRGLLRRFLPTINSEEGVLRHRMLQRRMNIIGYICLLTAVGLGAARLGGMARWASPTYLALLAAATAVFWLVAEVDSVQPLSERRLRWLKLQFDDGIPTRDLYSPGAYYQVTRELRSSGDFKDARRIASARLTLERKLVAPLPIRPVMMVFGWFFDYGLSPIRALVVFSISLAVGAIGVDVADKGMAKAVDQGMPALSQVIAALHIDPSLFPPVLVVNTSTVNTLAVVDPKSGLPVPDMAYVETRSNANGVPTELPCNDQIDPFLYAVDLFVPALQLNQQSRCSIRTSPDAIWWRYARATYSACGWVITALTILTVSGILRRQAES